MATEEAATTLEEQVKKLEEELEVCKEAKTLSEACSVLSEFAEKEGEPFSASHEEPNEWHKSAGGGGGCSIL